jgi:hypothetical protein
MAPCGGPAAEIAGWPQGFQKAGCPLLVLSEPGQLVLYAQLIEFEFLDIRIFGARLLLEGLDLSVEESMAVA